MKMFCIVVIDNIVAIVPVERLYIAKLQVGYDKAVARL